jgi:transcriptional regulator with XRE-family HTH domain
MRLRETREKKKMSAADVARKASLNRTFIYDIESGRKNPSLETIVKLSEVYNDPSLVQEYIRAYNISDVQIDVSLSADKERIFAELSRQDSNNHIGKTIYSILKNNEEALDEWTSIVNDFIQKYNKKKPNED